MNEVGWCYQEGFGTKKDKVSIATINTPLSLNDNDFLFLGPALWDLGFLCNYWASMRLGQQGESEERFTSFDRFKEIYHI